MKTKINAYHINENDYNLSSVKSIKKISSLLSDLIKVNYDNICIFYLFKSIDESEEALKLLYPNKNYKIINRNYYVMQWEIMFNKLKDR